MSLWAERAEQLRLAYQAFADELARVTPERRDQPLAAGEWTPHAVVSHLVGWDAALADGLQWTLGGTPELFAPPTDVDAFNAASVAARAGQAWTALEQGLAMAQARVQSLVPAAERAGLPSDGAFARWVTGRCEDCRHHTSQLAVAAGRQSAITLPAAEFGETHAT